MLLAVRVPKDVVGEVEIRILRHAIGLQGAGLAVATAVRIDEGERVGIEHSAVK